MATTFLALWHGDSLHLLLSAQIFACLPIFILGSLYHVCLVCEGSQINEDKRISVHTGTCGAPYCLQHWRLDSMLGPSTSMQAIYK